MKPNTRIINYVTLVQDEVLTLDDVPQDVQGVVTKWLRYLSGIEDKDGMVKDNSQVEATKPVEPKQVEKQEDPTVPVPMPVPPAAVKKAGE